MSTSPTRTRSPLDRIMSFGVMFTPALVVDGEVKVAGRVPSIDDVTKMTSDDQRAATRIS